MICYLSFGHSVFCRYNKVSMLLALESSTHILPTLLSRWNLAQSNRIWKLFIVYFWILNCCWTMEYNKPDALVLTGNLVENWRIFREAFEIYIEAAGLTTASNKRQVAIFLNLVSKEGLERYNTLTFQNVEDNKKIEQVLKAFQDYCKPKKKYSSIQVYIL